MSLSLTVKDATFTKYVSQLVPYMALAKGFYLFGGTQAASLKNYANPGLPATVLGAPTYGAGYANLTSTSDGFDSGISSRSGFTHIGIITAGGNSTGYFGNWNQAAGAAGAANLVGKASGLAEVRLALEGNYRVTSSAPALGSSFQFVASSYDGATGKLYVRDAASMKIDSAAYALTATPLAQPFRVGGSGFVDATVFKAAAAMTFQQVMTDGQVAEIYAYLKTFLATRGISVI